MGYVKWGTQDPHKGGRGGGRATLTASAVQVFFFLFFLLLYGCGEEAGMEGRGCGGGGGGCSLLFKAFPLVLGGPEDEECKLVGGWGGASEG